MFAECARTLEPGGRIAVNVANLGRKPYRSLSADVTAILQDRLRLLLRGEIIWQKGKGASGSCAWGSFAKPTNPTFRDITERVVVASKGRFDRAQNPRAREHAGLPLKSTVTADRFMDATLDVWEIPPESARRVEHPAPFPVELPEWLIDLYTYEGDLVLDPFMGSGSTMVAAVRTRPALRRLRHRSRSTSASPSAGWRRSTPADRRSAWSCRSAHSTSPGSEPSRPATTTDKDADFQRRATEEGKAAQAIAEKVLADAGFEIVGRNARLRGLGMTMNFVAVDQRDEEWYFDVSGAFSSNRGGLRRTDTLWKSLGRAHVLANSDQQTTPVILLTSHLPATGHRRRPGAARRDRRRVLRRHRDVRPGGSGSAAGIRHGRAGRPVVGFWTAEEIEDSRRWASP